MKTLNRWGWTYFVFNTAEYSLSDMVGVVLSSINGPHVIYLLVQVLEGVMQFKTVNHRLDVDKSSDVMSISEYLKIG